MLRKPLLCALTLVLLGAASAGALTPHLVKDINPVATNGGSEPRLFVTLDNGITLFRAEDGENGVELWRSDGTEAGTYPLTDTTCPTFCDLDPNFGSKAVGGRFFFTVWDESFQPTLWVTGGSAEDTFPLAEVGALLNDAVWMQSQGVLYFRTLTFTQEHALWRTDGTPAGTREVLPRGVLSMAEYKGRLFFSSGGNLWSTDGTAAGTRLVHDPLPRQSGHGGPEHLKVVGPWLLYFAPHPVWRQALWRSDGTRPGTTPLLRIDGGLIGEGPGPGIAPVELVAGRLWFVVTLVNQNLWTSDGTPGGTRRLATFKGGIEKVSVPRVALGGRVVFPADDAVHGMEPWISNGTLAGTRLLRDVCPGGCSSNPGPIATLGNRFFFGANDGTRGVEPWLSDGTTAGTRLLRDLCRGSCSSTPQAPRTLGGWTIFAALDAQGRSQLWRTNGTANGTIRLTTLPRGVEEIAARPGSGALLFRAWDAERDEELWSTDGTRPGTRLVADIRTADVGGSFPRQLIPAGQVVGFVADAPDSTGTLRPGYWKSGGTAASTVLLGDLPSCNQEPLLRGGLPDGSFLFFCDSVLWRGDGTAAGTFSLLPASRSLGSPLLVISGDSIFFSSSNSDEEEAADELWVSHGLRGDAHRVADFAPGTFSVYTEDPTPLQGRLIFTAPSDELGQRVVWAADGTGAEILPFPAGLYPVILGEHAGRIWLVVSNDSGYELWSTDGTPAGTRKVTDLPGFTGGAEMVSAGSRMFLSDGDSLWVSDGTEAGTRRIDAVTFRPTDSQIGLQVVATDGHLFFTLYNGIRYTLWQSDGTEEGSGQVLGSNSLPIADPENLTAFAGRLYFHRDGALWSTDGMPAGTLRVEGNFTAPEELTVVGNRLYFRANDPVHGTELWALD